MIESNDYHYRIPASSLGVIQCQWCGNWHTGPCLNVKSIEYHPNGAIKRVEFFDKNKQVIYFPVHE